MFKHKKNIIFIVVFLVIFGLFQLFIVRDFFNLSNAVSMEEKWRFEFLIERGEDINEVHCYHTTYCYTPLLLAVLNDNKYFVSRLLELGANTDLPKNLRPMTSALIGNDVEIVDLLLKHGVKLIESDKDMHLVFSADNPYFIELLLNRQNISLERLFCMVSDEYNILKYLLQHGVDPDYLCNVKLSLQPTKLFSVTREDRFAGNNSAAITQLLIDYNANVNFQDDCNNTPLHYAAEEGANHVVKTLLENSAKTGIKNCDGFTAYELAAYKNKQWVLKAFDDYSQTK